MTEQQPAPGQLEQTLGRLVEAGVGDPVELAGLLGLEPRHIGRPLRRLTLAGVLESRAAGGFPELTPYGYEWLGIKVSQQEAPQVAVSAGPQLQPLHPEADEDPESEPESCAERVPAGKPTRGSLLGWALRRGRTPLVRLRLSVASVAWRVPGLRLALPGVGVTVGGAPLSAAAGRRIAAGAAAVLVLMLGAQACLRAASIGGVPAPAAPAPAAQAPGSAATGAAGTPTSTPQAVAPSPPARWVVVAHTNGLGLVLRPAPASPERVLTLQEGARVRVTGDPVQQGGRAWLPVASPTGKTGWVADDFVAAVP